jgi:hypothetical protein
MKEAPKLTPMKPTAGLGTGSVINAATVAANNAKKRQAEGARPAGVGMR